MEYEQDFSEKGVSKLNSGMLINFRLNDLWKDATKYATTGDYSRWNDILDRVWCELAGDVGETNKEIFKQYAKLTEEYGKAVKSSIVKKNGFSKVNNVDRLSFSKQKIVLIKKEIFLRRLQNKQGKGTAYVEDEDYWE